MALKTKYYDAGAEIVLHQSQVQLTGPAGSPIKIGTPLYHGSNCIGIATSNMDNDGYVKMVLNTSRALNNEEIVQIYNGPELDYSLDMNVKYSTIISRLAKLRYEVTPEQWLNMAAMVLSKGYNIDIDKLPKGERGTYTINQSNAVYRSIRLWNFANKDKNCLHPQLQYLLNMTDALNKKISLDLWETINADQHIINKVANILGPTKTKNDPEKIGNYDEFRTKQITLYCRYGEKYITTMNNLEISQPASSARTTYAYTS